MTQRFVISSPYWSLRPHIRIASTSYPNYDFRVGALRLAFGSGEDGDGGEVATYLPKTELSIDIVSDRYFTSMLGIVRAGRSFSLINFTRL